mmetsp:Transcript_10320/g.26846  ORF Transcript_10320/g.26846 Transcript_10320/m.26846 type:complete len:131 (-) Transcript_10320:342-734(-)
MAAPYQGGPSGGAGEINRVQEVQLQVEEVQGVMRENVSQMLSNYEKAEVLEDKAASLTEESKKFYKRSNQVKKNMCMKNAKMNALIAFIVVVILLVIIVPVVVHATSTAAAAESAKEAAGDANATESTGG